MQLTRLSVFSLVGLVSCLATDYLPAQQGGGRFMGSRARYQLATLPEVQSDLKLNDEQKKLATDLLAKQRDKLRSAGQGADFQALRAELTKLNTEFESEFAAKLTDAQKSRIDGLFVQVNGAAALLDPAIAKAVGISEDQNSKLKAANDASSAARREAFQGLQNATQEERAAALEKLTNEANKALMAICSDEQKKKFEELKGSILTIDLAPLRQRRGNN